MQSDGSDWQFQSSTSLETSLVEGLREIGDWLSSGKGKDKQNFPAFAIASGPGVGKSRVMQQLPELLQNFAPKNVAARLSDAVVINVSFENGTPATDGERGGRAVGRRMLHQLLRPDKVRPFSAVPATEVDAVLEALAQVKECSPKELTVVLCVDGLHQLGQLSDVNGNCASAVRETCAAMIGTECLMIVCVAATLFSPLDTAFHKSTQKRIYLEPPRVDASKIPAFKNPDPIVQLMISDADGHGRALECLQTALGSEVPTGSLIQTVVSKLQQAYEDIPSEYACADVLRTLLTQKRVSRDFVFSASTRAGTRIQFTVDALLQGGLFRLVASHPGAEARTGHLSVAFVWFLLLARKCADDPLLTVFQDGDALELDAASTTEWRPHVYKFTAWEDFNALYRKWKCDVFAGETLPWKELHRGAKFGPDVDGLVRVGAVEIHQAAERFDTKSDSWPLTVRTASGTIDLPGNNGILVINGEGAPAGDSCLPLLMESGEVVSEAHQPKLYSSTLLTDQVVIAERTKATCSKDYLVILSTGPSTISHIPNRTAVVSGHERAAYYGPFAGRAFCFQTSQIDPNKATRAVFEAVYGVGRNTADALLKARGVRKFDSLGDCCQRVKEANNNRMPPNFEKIASSWYWI